MDKKIREEVLDLYKIFKRPCDIATIISQMYNLEYDSIYDSIQKMIKRRKNKDHGEQQISMFENIKPNVDLINLINDTNEKNKKKDEKRTVVQNQEPESYDKQWDGNRTITIGIIGDTQIGSKYTQWSYLNDFYKLCEERGIKDIYHTGDIVDGLKMRPGHEYELYLTSADDMLDDVIENYPRKNGIITHFITGNHDASIYKHIGYDIGKAISDKREDLDYLGRDCAVVWLTPNCSLELRHPWDGTAYALSYKPQKMIESMESDSKPNILAIGHYHKAEYLFYRNVHCLQTGCFQGQTPFTRGKGISVHLGGWIVTINVDSFGTIKSFSPEFIPYYSSIKDDYKNRFKK